MNTVRAQRVRGSIVLKANERTLQRSVDLDCLRSVVVLVVVALARVLRFGSCFGFLFLSVALDVVRRHHELCDGGGRRDGKGVRAGCSADIYRGTEYAALGAQYRVR